MAEAANELPLLAVGVYGRPLLKQHGAPIRVVVPWKYGYKSAKSIVAIELIGSEPATFWSTLNPHAYPFESNVDPEVPRPWISLSKRCSAAASTGQRRNTMAMRNTSGALCRLERLVFSFQ